MENSPSSFDPSDVDTPEGMTPAVGIGSISGVPAQGTGLFGEVYHADSINNMDAVDALVAAADGPDATFTASQVYYGDNSGDGTLEEFLADDADSIDGDGTVEFAPSAIVLTGYIYIPAGVHEISIASDDGYRLDIGGVDFSEYSGRRPTDETARVAEFDGGLYPIELSYFDGGGGRSLQLMVDGMPVDQSAYYAAESDFTNPPADVTLVPVDEYHPSYFVGEHSVEGAVDGETTDGRDEITGRGSDDDLDGGAGDDEILGYWGDDKLEGGDGNDVLDGGYGSDLLIGGDGDDLLISRSDAGEQRIGQLAIGEPTRDDPDGEVDNDLQKLAAYADQPLVGDDIMVGGEGRDTFLFLPQLNAKLDIIEKHVRIDGTINWAGVAGENDELHDHWVDSFGIEVIADYNAEEDHIAVIGHTANVTDVTYRDIDGDGDEESIVTILSLQHGGGGAHTQDLIGQIIVYGDRVEADDIETDNGVTYGIVENYADVAEAIYQPGEEKISIVDGEEVKGYDTRDENGNLGAVTGNPEDYVDNPFEAEVTYGDPQPEEPEETRAPFEPIEMVEAQGQTYTGTNGADDLSQEELPEPSGLPGALALWTFDDGEDGRFSDARGGNDAVSYTRYENQALLNTDSASDDAPTGRSGSIEFYGDEDFAFIHHDEIMAFSQGTIALWVRPDDLTDQSAYVTKDARNSGDGGHFRLGHTDDGKVFLRMAEGDGGSNHTWETKTDLLTEGEWSHIAVSFTEDEVIVYVDGVPVPASDWTATEGDVASPNAYTEAFLIQNEEPWVLGADQRTTDHNDSAQEFATDARNLSNPLDGAIAEFGVWGGFEPTDALTQAEVNDLIDNGPGAALTNPSGIQDMQAADDMFDAGAGNDTVDAGAGDDTVDGGDGNDEIHGGYGDDELHGGDGDDTLDGGRGSDMLVGGDGDDVLYSRSDAGEQRLGQLVLGEPSREFPDPSIDPVYLKLVDWVDQPITADDILIGGEGNDHFKFETLINGKKDIIMDNLQDDGRTVNWHGVAGENQRLHDHWVDAFGIDIIADYNADEDKISVIGHTTQVKVDYHTVDTDGNGLVDDMVSVITAYSQQGNGGAHDEDYLGYIVVYGDLVNEDDIEVDAGAHYGIVDTIDEIQEAVAPSGELREDEYFGYDTRDIDGDPIGSRPEDFTSNDWYNDGEVALASSQGDVEEPEFYELDTAGTFDGETYATVQHTPEMALQSGTYAFSFTADEIGETQALVSKDHSNFEDGGHLNIYLDGNGRLKVRFQSTDAQLFLQSDDKFEAGEEVHVSFSFSPEGTVLYINGEVQDTDESYPDGMLNNEENILVGASSHLRKDDDDRATWFFAGEISDVVIVDRDLTPLEALLLAESDNDPDALADIYQASNSDDDGDDDGDGDDTGDDTGGDDDGDTGGDDTGGDDGNTGGDDSDDDDDVTDGLIETGTNAADTMTGTDQNDQLRGGNGHDDISGNGGNDDLRGNRGADTISGGEGDDEIRGGRGHDDLTGGVGEDTIYGGRGHDEIFGGADDDLIIGGYGNDELTGGAGSDIFQFGGAGAATADTVLDFNVDDDLVALRSEGFGQTGDVTVTLGAAASGTGAQFVYNSANGELRFDANGSNGGQSSLVATFTPGLALEEDNFTFV